MAERRVDNEQQMTPYSTIIYSADTLGPIEKNINRFQESLAVIRGGIKDVEGLYGVNNAREELLSYSPHGYMDHWNDQLIIGRTPFVVSAIDEKGAVVGAVEGRIYKYMGSIPAIYVNWIVVKRDDDQDIRRRGIGTYLYSQLEELAKKYGVELLIAGVNPLNFPSEGLHNKLGYVPNAVVSIPEYNFPHDFDTNGELIEPSVTFFQKTLPVDRAGALRHHMLSMKTEDAAINRPLSAADLVYGTYVFRDNPRPLSGNNSIVARTLGLNFNGPDDYSPFYEDKFKGDSYTEFAEAQRALLLFDESKHIHPNITLMSLLEEVGDVYFQSLVAIFLHKNDPDFPEAFDKLYTAVEYLRTELQNRNIPDDWVDGVMRRKYTMRLMRNLQGKMGKDKVLEQKYLGRYVSTLLDSE